MPLNSSQVEITKKHNIKCQSINVLPEVLRFLDSLTVIHFLKIVHVWQHLLIWFAAGFIIVQSNENYIQMSL